ncbi:histidine--tRNA ligase [Candidatus Woesearchaeota archaeon]|nr:MAG: histidine--tRNA ligase [Candidatus Woesearchaeota archaeon]
MAFQRVRGTEDYPPKEHALHEAIQTRLKEQAKRFGFSQVDTPAIETLKLLTAKSGEEIKEQLFVFEKKGSEEIALRFDLTVPLTRLFVEKQKEIPKPVKWFALAPMWRYEAPQKARMREFRQLSVELFGSKYPEADAQCINLALSCLNSFGLTHKDVVLKINNRKLLEGILQKIAGKEKIEEIVRIIDKSSKITAQEFKSELERAGCSEEAIGKISKLTEVKGGIEVIEKIREELQLDELAKEGLEELSETLDLVDKKYVQIDLSIARGLAYYTGNVYEIFDRKGKYRSIAGGGRYDNLVELFGGEPTPATGFAIGITPLSVVLEELGKLPETQIGPEYYIAPVNESVLKQAIEIAEKLRKKTSCDVDIMRRKLSKQFDYANSIGARKIIIVGEKDLERGEVTIRDLSTGVEKKVKIDSIHAL